MTKQQIPHFDQCHITILGDIMLDRYWHGQTGRISPEAPVPVVHVKNCEGRPGGAANVACNLSSLGCHAHLFGIRGDDEAGQELTEKCQQAQVDCHFITAQNNPTCTKLRVISRNQQLLRLDFEEQIANIDATQFSQFDAVLAQSQTLILSDYGKGTIQQASTWINKARARKLPILVDPKGHDFARYQGASILTPNFNEFEMVVGPCAGNESAILEKAHNAIAREQLQALLITRGKEGMMLVTAEGQAHSFPAMAREVFDVTGAGDTVIATLAAFIAAGYPYAEATEWANYAAGCVVAKLGAASITLEELASKVAHHQAPLNTGMMSLAEAKAETTRARSHGEKIVFTNGCFDILHAGHVHYLQQAKAFGDRLIVAVNDDDSVRRLKGEGRPINRCNERMKILAALDVVDWVIPFSEDTPLKIIEALCPDVLVKGGDYQIDTIVGADFVQTHGGQVKVLDFVDGLSTTKTIETIYSRFTQSEAEPV